MWIAACFAVLWLSVPSMARADGPEWNVAHIHGPVATPGVVVAVVDTGVDGSHPTFAGRVLPEIDLVRDGRSGDPHGHGTHVAGIVAGGASGPVIGVAPGATILPVRVLGPDGSGSMDTVDQGIRQAADAGAAVINLSLSDSVISRSIFGTSLADAINYAWSKGSIAVLAAGNDEFLGAMLGSGYGSVPAVVVTATGSDDQLAGYATTVGNARWGIAAPGGDATGKAGQDVLSSWPDGQYALLAGTSMAAPHVSGTLAALRAAGLSASDAVDRMLSTANPIGPRSTYGAGLVDEGAAVAGLVDASPAPSSSPSAPEPEGTSPPESSAPASTSRAAVPATSAQTTTSTPVPSSAVSLPSYPAGTSPRAAPATLGARSSDGGGVPAPAAMAGVAACVGAWAAAIAVSRRGATVPRP